jgi:hypothetical protein
MEDKAYRRLWVSLVPWAVTHIFGTLFYRYYPGENLTLGEAIYMSCVTLTTVGFGAIHPNTNAGRLFASVWMVVGVSATGNMVLSFTNYFMRRHNILRAELLSKQLLEDMLNDADGDTEVDRCDFLRFELLRLGVADREMVDGILQRFEEMDMDGSGVLDHKDLQALHSSNFAHLTHNQTTADTLVSMSTTKHTV